MKCKVVTIKYRPSPLEMLPFVVYHYYLAVNVNFKYNFTNHCESFLTRANQKLGLLKRPCSFVMDEKRRRILYVALV